MQAHTNSDITSQSSPCRRNCCLSEDKVCLGCGRSLPEILEWHHADNTRQETIKIHAKQRLSAQQSLA